MGIPVKFTPFYGAQEEGPIASLLQINDFTVLLDCGWNDAFDVALLEPLTEYVKSTFMVCKDYRSSSARKSSAPSGPQLLS